jgi:hypothetical protein
MLTNEEVKAATAAAKSGKTAELQVQTILRSDRYFSEREACLAELKTLRDAAFAAEYDYNRLLLRTTYQFVRECELRFPHLIFSEQFGGIHVYRDGVKRVRLNYRIKEESDAVSVMFYSGSKPDCDCLTWDALELTLS